MQAQETIREQATELARWRAMGKEIEVHDDSTPEELQAHLTMEFFENEALNEWMFSAIRVIAGMPRESDHHLQAIHEASGPQGLATAVVLGIPTIMAWVEKEHPCH